MDKECQQGASMLNIECKRKCKSKINIDCIKVCPMNKSVWALSFYQQQPQFMGGVQVVETGALLETGKQLELGMGKEYIQLGPIMHIEWLDMTKAKQTVVKGNKRYYILAAHRCDEAIVLSYSSHTKLQICQRVVLQTNIFCLYCDWKVSSTQSTSQSLLCTAIVSSNQSSVFCFNIQIEQVQKISEAIQQKQSRGKCKIGEIDQYKKHEYAVWACKLSLASNSHINYMVVGDEVCTLYLYDISKKQLIATNKKAHTQGICQLMWKSEQLLMVGSFDGSISQINICNFAQVLRKYEIGGTIWRIIPIHINNLQLHGLHLICNSSEKQFQIYDAEEGKVEWRSGKEHQSLAYSADFNGQLIVTASFYDQAVSVWSCSTH